MAPAQPSSSPPPQPSLWRSSLAAALRRIARAVAPPQAAPRVSVTQPPERAPHSPQLPPPHDHAAGNGASQPAVVDPLERARAALRDARQHMTALMASEPPATTVPAPQFAPGERRVEPLHELLTELREERRALLDELAGMRSLLQETRAEVAALRQALRDRAAEVQALQQPPPAANEPPLAPPAPSLSELIADAGAAPAVERRDAELASAPADSSDSPAPAAMAQPASERLPESQPAMAPFRDFGWRLRPEAYPFDDAEAAPEAGSPSEPPAGEAVAPAEQASPPAEVPDDVPVEPPAVAAAVAEIEASTAGLADAAAAPAAAGESGPVRVVPRVSDFAPYQAPFAEDDGGQPNAPNTGQPAAPEASEGTAEPEPDAATAQAHGNEAKGEATLEDASLPDGVPTGDRESGAPAAEAPVGTAPGEGDDRGEEAGSEAEAIRLPAGSTRLVIGPVRSIGRLTALERRLVREPALAQVTLADFRRQLATIIVSARAPIAFAALSPALADEERHPVAAAWQADGSLQVTLGKRAEEGA